jgi:hypothetical protein
MHNKGSVQVCLYFCILLPLHTSLTSGTLQEGTLLRSSQVDDLTGITIHTSPHATPTEYAEGHIIQEDVSSIIASTVKTNIVAPTPSSGGTSTGFSAAAEARTADMSPADSSSSTKQHEDILRNTLFGVLGLLLSAGSLIVAVQHNLRNVCRQQDLESSCSSINHTELGDLREGETRQRRGQSPGKAEGFTAHVSRIGHDSRVALADDSEESASLMIRKTVFGILRCCSGAIMQTIAMKARASFKQQSAGASAEQLPSQSSVGQSPGPVLVQPAINTQNEALELSV